MVSTQQKLITLNNRAAAAAAELQIDAPAPFTTLKEGRKTTRLLEKKIIRADRLRNEIEEYADDIGRRLRVDIYGTTNTDILYRELRRLRAYAVRRAPEVAQARRRPRQQRQPRQPIGPIDPFSENHEAKYGMKFESTQDGLMFNWPINNTITPEQLQDVFSQYIASSGTPVEFRQRKYKIMMIWRADLHPEIDEAIDGSADLMGPIITFDIGRQSYHTIYNKIRKFMNNYIIANEAGDEVEMREEYGNYQPDYFILAEIPTINPELQEQKFSETDVNCAIGIVLDEVNAMTQTKNTRTMLRKLTDINAEFLESGINNSGLQAAANATMFRIVVGDKKAYKWQEFEPLKRDGTKQQAKKTLYMIAHNNHISKLPANAKIIDNRVDYDYSIFDRFINKTPPVTFVNDDDSLRTIQSSLTANKTIFESMYSQNNIIAVISEEHIYKLRFDECEQFPSAYTDAGVGKIKFFNQQEQFKNAHGKSYELCNQIGDMSNQCGFYLRLGKSDKDNIKYDMKKAYFNFRNSNLFRGFPIIDAVFDISEYRPKSIGKIFAKYSHGMIYLEYEPLTLDYMKACGKVYFEGSQWYPIEIVKAILSTMPADKRKLVKFKLLATAQFDDTFDIDFSDFTNPQFRGFIGKCESKPQPLHWSTTDRVEYLRARYIIGEDITGLQSIKQTDIYGNPFTEYRITYLQKRLPWRFPIIASYVKHHQRYSLFRQYNKIMDSIPANSPNPVIYIAVDGIELKSGTNVTDLFDDSWRKESIKVCKGANRVIKREIPDISQFAPLSLPEIVSEIKPPLSLPETEIKQSEQPKTTAPKINLKYSNAIKVSAFLGPAGCGKSYKILDMSDGALYIAPTNEAIQSLKDNATQRNIQITAMTIHKAFGFQCKKLISFHNYSKIIIDEISMVSLELILKMVKQLFANNWRGHLYFAGDFKQLAAVGGTRMFKRGKFHKKLIKIVKNIDITNMTTNYRQNSDAEFYEICQQLREGYLKPEQLSLLNSRVRARWQILKYEKKGMTLAGINKQVDAVNGRFKYAEGVPIIITKNIPKLNIFNGNIFEISSIIDNSDESDSSVTISRGETNLTMPLERLKNISKIARATTIHKSQGKTIRTRLIINPTRLFDPSHLYVAITRATCLKNIVLTDKINPVTLPNQHKIAPKITFDDDEDEEDSGIMMAIPDTLYNPDEFIEEIEIEEDAGIMPPIPEPEEEEENSEDIFANIIIN